MYVKEICLEGFKSYATRTVVSGFDPFFNAITGLNGSGKSNILDSICFVLGITNLQQVRATNLQELVYKQGQAGITKATVSIVFDNSDRSRSPLGYEDCPEITVTRQVLGAQASSLLRFFGFCDIGLLSSWVCCFGRFFCSCSNFNEIPVFPIKFPHHRKEKKKREFLRGYGHERSVW